VHVDCDPRKHESKKKCMFVSQAVTCCYVRHKAAFRCDLCTLIGPARAVAVTRYRNMALSAKCSFGTGPSDSQPEVANTRWRYAVRLSLLIVTVCMFRRRLSTDAIHSTERLTSVKI
jgi:hypothetical protein